MTGTALVCGQVLADPAALAALGRGARASYEAHYTPERNLGLLEAIYADAIAAR